MPMKCLYCQSRAGFLRRFCRDCRQLIRLMQDAPASFGYRELLDRLMATNVPTAKIQSFLDRDIDGRGSLNDQLTARMTNQIMASLGQPSSMTADGVKKVKEDIAAGRAPSQVEAEVISMDQLKDKN